MSSVAEPAIVWYSGSVESAFAAARAQNKPVFLYWGAKWCPPCHELQATVFSRPYRNPADGQAYLQQASHYSDRAIAYTKEICTYLYETYGRFPAHVDAFYATGMWVQFSHLEMEYYERFFDPHQYTRQSQHDALWHSAPAR